MTVCVTCRNGCYGSEFHLDGTCSHNNIAFVQSALYQDSLPVRLSEFDLAFEEAGLVILHENVVNSLILDHRSDRNAYGP